MWLFDVILYQPTLNALMFLYKILPGHDLGLAIIILTIIIKFILYIPSLSSIKQQRKMQDIQPEINRIKEQYKNNREEQGKKLMEYYKNNKVNPFSSCLPMLIQLPIIYAMFQVFYNGLATDAGTGILVQRQLDNLYGPLRSFFAVTPINHMFMGFVDLSRTGNIVLAVMAGLLQFWQSRMLITKQPPKNMPGAKDESMMASTNKMMTYFFPILMIYFSYRFPAGLSLYWVVVTLFSIGQQYLYFRKHPVSAPKTQE